LYEYSVTPLDLHSFPTRRSSDLMTRTIVSVFANNDRVSFNLYLAPGDIPNARDLYDFGCTENDPPFMQMSQGLLAPDVVKCTGTDRKSTRLNSSHVAISYAVFCL